MSKRRPSKKSTRQPHTQGTEPPPLHQGRLAHLRSQLPTWVWVGGILGVPGFVLTVLSLQTHLDVSPSFKRDPSSAYSEFFVVSNAAFFTIYDLEFTCIQDWFKDVHGNHGVENIIRQPIDSVPKLGPGAKHTIQCRADNVTQNEIIESGISLAIKYRTLLPLYTAEQSFHFLGVLTKDGQMHWTPQ